VVGAALLVASLLSHVDIVNVVVLGGDAPPGIADREVPLNVTSFFRVTLAVGSCAVSFYLLTDSQHDTFRTEGRLPVPTLNCNRTEATIRARVGHMVTVSNTLPGASNVSYTITADILAERHPYALLSIVGLMLAMASTIWIAGTLLNQGTAKLADEFHRRQQEGKK